MKLIFINSLPTAKIFGKKVDAWWYQRHGFDVEFWDLSPMYWTKIELEGYYGGADDYRYVGPNHRVFSSKKDVLKSLFDLPRKSIIWELDWGIRRIQRDEAWLLMAVVDCNLPYFIQEFEADPICSGLAGWRQCFRLYMASRCYIGREPVGVIGSGRVVRSRVGQVYKSAKFISVPSPKVSWESLPAPVTTPYVVFVDENIEYSPDAKMLGFTVSSDLSGYFRRINQIFSLVEDLLGCPVVVAASGKYHYTEDRFEGRKLIYGQTFALIQHASFVIGHCSGALDQAIVSNKPILQLEDRSFSKVQHENVALSTKFTGVMSIYTDDMDSIIAYIKHPIFDASRAAEVKAMYFCEPGVEGDCREIIKKSFLSI